MTQPAPPHISAFVELLSNVLSRFADMRVGDLDAEISYALKSIAEFAGVDRSYVFTVDADGKHISNTHEWCQQGIQPEIDNLQQLPWEVIWFWREPLESGQAIYVPRVAEIPPDRADERALLEEQSIQSLIVVPLISEKTLLGFIGFDAVASVRDWQPIERQLLMAAADIISGGLVRHRMYRELADKERRFSGLVRYSADLTLIVDQNLLITYASDAVERVIGWQPAALMGRRLRDVVAPESYPAVDGLLSRELPEEGVDTSDIRALSPGGGSRWLSGHVTDRREDPLIAGFIVNLHDISERKRAEEALQYRAMHDPLTGLANRALLAERLETLARTEYHAGRPVGVLFIDLDHFKSVNDSLGHDVGDQLLVDVADRLRRSMAEIELVARFGGDEFVVLLQPGMPRDQLVRAAAAIMDAFELPFAVDGRERLVSASAGLVVSDRDHNPSALLRDADAAMYQAKIKGRSRIEHYDVGLQNQLRTMMSLSHDLRDAIREGQLELYFQPVVTSNAATWSSVEALLRWHHPERGMVLPAEFIQLAEENGAIVAIGDWVFESTVRQIAAWQHAPGLPRDFKVSVNLSGRQLLDDKLAERMRTCLKRHGVFAGTIALEVRESTIAGESETTLPILRELVELGFSLTLDDFGTGYSSMAYLRDLPANTLKIDNTFSTKLLESERDRMIVKGMIDLARQLDMQPVLEGVETAAQLDALRALDPACHAQGYALAEPMPAMALEKQWVART